MTFIKPVFDGKGLELRFDNNEVCIYGTKEGLRKLADIISSVANGSVGNHVHLEDRNLLTDISLIGAIALFND